jgi:hypothetical protein
LVLELAFAWEFELELALVRSLSLELDGRPDRPAKSEDRLVLDENRPNVLGKRGVRGGPSG